MSNKLILKTGKIPLKACLKLAFKNLWKKKLRYFIMLIICTLSLTFLSFTIELNGEKLRQNTFTMIKNGYRYTEIFEHSKASKDDIAVDYYNKYAMAALTEGAYENIKANVDDIVIHDYANVNINYVGTDIENANFFFTGYIDTLIRYDETNNYELLCGRTPKLHTKEIMITDYLVASLMYFNVYPSFTSVYDYLNIHLNLNHNDNYKVVGIIKTNYERWKHLANIERVETSDKENYPYLNDFTFMNSVIINEEYFKVEKLTTSSTLAFNNPMIGNPIANWSTKVTTQNDVTNVYEPNGTLGLTYQKLNVINFWNRFTWSRYYFGREVEANDEIVIPYYWVDDLFNIAWVNPSNTNDWAKTERMKAVWNTVKDAEITLTFANSTKNLVYSKTFKIVGISNSTDIVNGQANTLLGQITMDAYQEIYSYFNQVEENILVQLPNDPNEALNLFNRAQKAGYIINVFGYKADIEGYDVDPFIELASKVGLFVFAIFTMGMMWTIISIEIVDSKKEIGILRSIGLSSGKVSFIFVFQTALIILLSYSLSNYISSLLIPIYNSGIMDDFHKITLYMYTFTYRTPLYLGIFVIFMTLISTFFPLFKIMNKKIIDVINERDN